MLCVSTQPSRLYLEPKRHFTIPALVELSGRPQPTVAREVERLTEAGPLRTELRSGPRSVWAATTSPIFDELHSILLKTIGPKAVLEERFRDVRGVDRALIYGSWARRYHGVPGPLPQDVDLMVIGTGDVAEIRAEVDIASRRLGRDVDVSVLTPEEWDASESGFVTHLKSEPSVELSLLR